MFHQRNNDQESVISVLDSAPVSVFQPRNGEPETRDAANGRTRPIDGVGRNHVALSEPLIVETPDADRWDMARLASGDEQALDSLMHRHGKKLLRHMERMVRNHSDAKELVNEAFTRVFRHRRDYNFESRFSTWLYVIGSHLAINLLRWRSRRPEFVPLAETAGEQSSATADSLIDPAPTPCEQAESDEWTSALAEALARLPQQLRVPLLLVSLDSCSQAEVAARLGCTVKAVETRLYHGRKRLRAELESILNPWQCRLNGAIHSQSSR